VAASTTTHGASRHSRHAGSRRPAEILRGDGVEEFPELLDLVFLFIRDGHAHLVQDLLAGEDLRAGAQGQRNRAPVRRASAIESDGRALTSAPLEKIRSA